MKSVVSFSIAILSLLTTTTVCAIDIELTSAAPAKIQAIGSQSTSVLEANKSASISLSEPLWVTSDGRVPVLLIPVDGRSANVSLDAPKADEALKSLADTQLNQIFGQIMSEIADVQSLMRNKQLPAARVKLQSLMAKHPGLTFLKFNLASLLLLEGERNQALQVAEEASKSLPDYLEGKEFINRLKGVK